MSETQFINGESKSVVGTASSNLLLKTLGRVQVQVGDKFYDLNIDGNTENQKKIQTTIVPAGTSIDDAPYPGDGALVFDASSGILYIAINGEYESVSSGSLSHYEDDIIKNVLQAISKDALYPLKGDGTSDSISSNWTISNAVWAFYNTVLQLNSASMTGSVNDSASWEHNSQHAFNDTIFLNKGFTSTGFTEGYHGSGVALENKNNEYYLTTDYLTVRKAMKVYELIVNQIKATNGSLWVSDSAVVELVFSVDSSNDAWYAFNEDEAGYSPESSFCPYYDEEMQSYLHADRVITIEGFNQAIDKWNIDNPGNLKTYWTGVPFEGNVFRITLDNNDSNDYINPFRLNDIIRCQQWTGTSILFYEAIVTDILGTSVNVRMRGSSFESNPDGLIGSIATGDEIVRVSNSGLKDRQGSIYLTSSDEGAPYIDVYENYRYAYGVDERLESNDHIKVRLGKLDGLAVDNTFGELNGYGIFLNGNCYIKGKIAQVSDDPTIDPEPTLFPRGEYKNNAIYYKGDMVTYNGGSYHCIKNTVVPGISPSDTEYWEALGGRGQAISFRGAWTDITEETIFYNDELRVDIVKHNNQYWFYNFNEAKSKQWLLDNAGIPGKSELHWTSAGASFSSVATDILLANNANLAGFIFNYTPLGESVLSSETNDADGNPILQLNGTTGNLIAKKGVIGPFSVDSNNMILEADRNSIQFLSDVISTEEEMLSQFDHPDNAVAPNQTVAISLPPGPFLEPINESDSNTKALANTYGGDFYIPKGTTIIVDMVADYNNSDGEGCADPYEGNSWLNKSATSSFVIRRPDNTYFAGFGGTTGQRKYTFVEGGYFKFELTANVSMSSDTIFTCSFSPPSAILTVTSIAFDYPSQSTIITPSSMGILDSTSHYSLFLPLLTKIRHGNNVLLVDETGIYKSNDGGTNYTPL